MIRHIKQYLAVRSYMRGLSQDLVRRFGKKSLYTVQQVTQAVERGKFSAAFIAYSHAAFCCQADFDGYYQSLGVSCSYQGLRRTIGRRYLYGKLDFDAATIISRFRRANYGQGEFYESGLGEDYPIHRN